MGIGRNNSIAGALGLIMTAALLAASPIWAMERHSGIWRILHAGHFRGPMNEEAHVRPIKGSIVAKGKRYKFWEYSWSENRPSGHGRTLLLVFAQTGKALSYLGCYEFEGHDFHGMVHPEIRGKVVFFPYKDYEILGTKVPKEISFENGPPAVARVGDAEGGEFSR
jgi:hypothetical protein